MARWYQSAAICQLNSCSSSPSSSSNASLPLLSPADRGACAVPQMMRILSCNHQLQSGPAHSHCRMPLRMEALLPMRPPLSQKVRADMSSMSWRRRLLNGDRCSSVRCDAGDKNNTESKAGSISTLELEREEEPSSIKKKPSYNGIFLILLLNIGIFVADYWLGIPGIRRLYLYHDMPRWYQFITSTFCHLSWNHLSSNLFFLYIFGKLVEEEGGGFGVWLSYLVTGVGANLVSWLILPRSVVSAGASGAVFGLFAISVLVKLSFDWRKILEVLILGQFVVERVMEAAHASAHFGGHVYNSSMNINHIAHLSGALVGVALIWLLRRLPVGESEKK